MKCKCIHSDVCFHRQALQEAFRSIIDIHIGGRNPKFVRVDELIQSVCRFRTPRGEEHGAQQTHGVE